MGKELEVEMTEEEIHEAIKHANKLLDLLPLVGSDSKTGYWSGCNYHINRGNAETEPVGSASAMTDCDMCECFTLCEVKQLKPVFRMNAAIDQDINEKFAVMQQKMKSLKLQ